MEEVSRVIARENTFKMSEIDTDKNFYVVTEAGGNTSGLLIAGQVLSFEDGIIRTPFGRASDIRYWDRESFIIHEFEHLSEVLSLLNGGK